MFTFLEEYPQDMNENHDYSSLCIQTLFINPEKCFQVQVAGWLKDQ